MAKLYFRYGTVGSAKTLNLLAVAHNYRQQGKKPFLLKPKLDDRFGSKDIKSRAGLIMEADVQVEESSDLFSLALEGVSCLLVDEVQFFSPFHIDQLREISLEYDIPVICYGLRTDFRGKLFPGSLRLLEVADSIEEVKATCFFCHKKSIMNLRLQEGEPTLLGETVELGAEEKYLPTCYKCYTQQTAKAKLASEMS